MYKAYLYKYTGEFKGDYEILNNFTFSDYIGSGQGACSLLVKTNEDLVGYFVKIFAFERLVYTGRIIDFTVNFDNTGRLDCIGLFNLLNQFYTGNTITYAQELSNLILEDSSDFSYFFGTPVFSEQNLLIRDTTSGQRSYASIISSISREFFLGADGIMHFSRSYETGDSHILTIGEEIFIDSSSFTTSIDGYINRVSIYLNNTFLETRVNEENILEFGKSEYVYVGNISNSESMQSGEDKFLGKQARAVLSVKTNWNYKVGDLVKISNSPIEFPTQKITKIDYGILRSKIYLGEYKSIAKNLN